MMEKCRNCNDLGENILQNSHIIPEFFFKYVYSSNHKFMVIASDEGNHGKKEQKGFREKLLCKNCEQVLSKQEQYASIFFRELVEKNYNEIKVTIDDDLVTITNYDYLTIKKCLLSILWRASISTLTEFSKYDLGPYSTKIQKIVFSDDDISWNVFPILITKTVTSCSSQLSHIGLHGKNKSNNHKTIFTITLAGYNIEYFITESFDESFKLCFMNENFCAITPQLINLEINLKKRMIDPRIVNFYNKNKGKKQ